MRDYTAARMIWGVAHFFGVAAALLGFLVTGVAVCVLFGGSEKEKSEAVLVASCSAGALIGGALLAAASDLVLATIDTARNTQAILRHLQAEDSKK